MQVDSAEYDDLHRGTLACPPLGSANWGRERGGGLGVEGPGNDHYPGRPIYAASSIVRSDHQGSITLIVLTPSQAPRGFSLSDDHFRLLFHQRNQLTASIPSQTCRSQSHRTPPHTLSRARLQTMTCITANRQQIHHIQSKSQTHDRTDLAARTTQRDGSQSTGECRLTGRLIRHSTLIRGIHH